MQVASKGKLSEIEDLISKMTLEVCCTAVLPELGLRWGNVSSALRSSRLPMTPASAARVLRRHIARSLPAEEYDDLLSRLRLKLVATQQRVWHLISLSEPVEEHPGAPARVHARVRQALREAKKPKDMTAVVESVNMGDLVYFSVQLVSARRQGAALFAAAAPGRPVALLSSLQPRSLVKAVVEGLGYKAYEDENLHGRDIPSLLRIHDRKWNEDNIQLLNGIPEYKPTPVITDNGIDFTNKTYNEEYVEKLLGPNPPLLTDLKIQSSPAFFDPARMKKDINVTIDLKSEDVAKTLKEWVKKGALAPNSPLIQIFHEMQSNSISYQAEE
ncbi:hypothetical protein MSG28_015904 [Choristoneura fumiferana]|uniref:Uncharacterized protein n=1 Tax=Choristoneura fumiferana TaxID=7141 RepID=A0ACC0K4R5_CHOFU|nr:hypothetical protein MSG28_015904 [Choristoneura fumiferana]